MARKVHTSAATPLRSTLLLLGIFSGLVAGCAADRPPNEARETGPARNSAEDLAGAPDWLTRDCRSHWKTASERREVVCAVGSAGPHRNRSAARETAVARARTAIARSIEVTIESLVRLEDESKASESHDLKTIVHQLSSASLAGCEVVAVWRAQSGTVHALVSLSVARVQQSVRESTAMPARAREDIALRAAEAFATLDEAFDE
jgi:hypothetical protein